MGAEEKGGKSIEKEQKIIIGMGESQMKKDDRVAFRPDKEGKLDDVFIKDVRLFRMERMDENAWWIHCYLEGEEDWGADFWLKSPEKIEAEVHSFPAYVKYEKGCREWVLKQVKDTLKKLKRQQEAYGLSLKDVIEEVETLKSNLEGD